MDKEKLLQKKVAHERFSKGLKQWTSLNRLTAKQASEILGVSLGVYNSWTIRPNQPKFPPFASFIKMIKITEGSNTMAQGIHGRKFNWVEVLTGFDKTDYEIRLEEENRNLRTTIQEQIGVIKHLEKKR